MVIAVTIVLMVLYGINFGVYLIGAVTAETPQARASMVSQLMVTLAVAAMVMFLAAV